uniref:Chaoptin n=1 Tax=Panagrolaimus sp. JU765 TaxID=591449 RepID=A0AC34R6V4_9BILA
MDRKKYEVYLISIFIQFFYLILIAESRCTEFRLSKELELCECPKVGPEEHVSLDCNGKRWISVPHIQKTKAIKQKIVAISMTNGFLMYVNQDAFRNTSAQTIDLSHNFIENINVNAFRGLEDKLFQLVLTQNSLSNIPHHSLTYLEQLRYLKLQYNQISEIPPYIFANVKLKNLKYLHLDKNKIDALQKNSLTNLPLQVLTISNNKITEIEKESLPKSLWFIDLKHNLLQTIPYLALRELKNLKMLDLESNNITYMRAHNEVKLEEDMTLQNELMLPLKKNLTELLLAFNQITDVPSNILEGMEKLKHLDLSKNRIEKIEEICTSPLPNLIQLNLAGNYLRQITDYHVFDSLQSLVYLDLSYNRLKLLGKTAFEKLIGLESLFLQNNMLKEFPRAALSGLSKLRYLLLDHNQITSLPNFAVQWLTHLERLSLSRNMIQSIGEKTFRAAPMQLKSLNLGYNQLSELSSHAFDSLPNLEQLFLNNNLITLLLPQTITNLGALRDLTLSNNKIIEISEYVFVDLPNLERLSLANNQIRHVPKTALSSTPKLELLDLSFNSFKHFNSEFLENTVKLIILDLSYNMISQIEIGNLRQSLQQLSLSHNRIKYLKAEKLVEFEQLKFINLSHNELIELDSDCFASCKDLAVIDLSNNNLRKIWKKTFDMQYKIQKLHLSNNYLSSLDHGVFGKNNIMELFLQNNNFTSVPSEALTSIRESLTILDLSNNAIKSLERKDFNGLQNITRLILANNKIETIDDEAFADLPLIEYLDLSNNPISTWSPHAFKSISESLSVVNLARTGLFSLPKLISRSLKVMNISYNKIFEIETTDIDVLKSVQILDASWNNIADIKPNILKHMPKLKYLDFNGNKLQTLTEEQLDHLDQLEVLKIAHLDQLQRLPNSFKFATLRNLKEFEIHHLPLSTSQYNITHILQVLPPLRKINIEIKETKLKNQLKHVDSRLLRSITIQGKNLKEIAPTAFEKLRGYKVELTIKNTEITGIHPLTFHTMHKISFLSLSLPNNKIEAFNPFVRTKPPVLNQHGTILERINLFGNPIMCTCEFQWMRPWIEYAAEHSNQLEMIQNDLEKTECDARPGIQDTLLSVYGDNIPGIKSKYIATITVNKMCSRHLSTATSDAPNLLLIMLSLFLSAQFSG